MKPKINDTIKLYNRYNRKIILKCEKIISEDNYVFSLTGDLKYCRHIYNENPYKLEAIDPDGGPYLSVNHQILEIAAKYKLKFIISDIIYNTNNYNIVLTFKK